MQFDCIVQRMLTLRCVMRLFILCASISIALCSHLV